MNKLENAQTKQEMENMIEEIKQKLQIVNGGAMKAEFYGEDKYKEIQEIHQMVMSKPSFSVNEMDAIVSELGAMRNK
ncbi:DUF1128 domain-containing protein [Alkalicoccus halolimnae]|jgi:uncharacterized protein YfkK (UPF0435 family)|uniref:UPF0435 protein FTX54_009430 n=1 Tax=Alkalicoccus halolimnae TaxID=1667239 RepID=A0A5C7FMZ8_9BACI|nr:DUF1128 domain-containing protein [Alkalicoccus halolimnae]TXF87369.1 DUF1128 domain-containing protein [Alkalicoccus halolimnae]